MDTEAFLGPLSDPWTVEPYSDDAGFLRVRFRNTCTKELQIDDPRLERLPAEWSRVEFERTADDPKYVDYFRNNGTGEIINFDSRLSREALERRGVKLQTFNLV